MTQDGKCKNRIAVFSFSLVIGASTDWGWPQLAEISGLKKQNRPCLKNPVLKVIFDNQ
jgi:hypothetical protein